MSTATEDLVDQIIDQQPTHDEEEAAYDAAREVKRRIENQLVTLRINEEARALHAREKRSATPRPAVMNLRDFLAQDDTDPTYRIAQVWPTGGRVMLEAQFKAGKTTLVGNVLRSLADGDPFLDRFDVAPGAKVALIDNELDQRTLRRWLNDQAITNQSAVALVPLRGHLGAFDIRDTEVRAEWATALRGADVIVLDCLRPVLDALGLDENHDAGQFLVAFDALLAEAGATEALVVHHMGHGAERARGDSRLKDWPDAAWQLVRDKDDEDPTKDDPSGSRYFSAFGRDVNHQQSELQYDHDSRRLTLGIEPRNRRQVAEERKTLRARDAVLEVVGTHPGIGKVEIRTAVRAHGITHNPEVDRAVDSLITDGGIIRQKAGQKHMHYLPTSHTLALVPNMPNDAPGTVGMYVPSAPIGHGHTNATPEDPAHHQEPGHGPNPTTTPTDQDGPS